MKWDTLFSMQKKLDTYISDNHNLDEKDLFEERFLALLVELGELANETRCFKFWSNKPKSDTSIILEEYVDNIHFLMSIGLQKGFTFSEIEYPTTYRGETIQFNYVFQACLEFYTNQSEEKYMNMFKEYLLLAELLGFSEQDIQKAYDKKNEVNYERQEQGY